MFKRIEVWNWESHEHTILDSLSPGLNLIWGLSNAGKSSIIRFLRFICYNDFSPKSVRVGAKFCKGLVETDKGMVQVTRGEGVNRWEVTPIGGPMEVFEKIGKQSIPRVSDILGVRLVKLGDIEMPVNIMDQLEGHFMLAEFAGKDATGSLRAQVIDEISGLTGIEVLVKSVSLDNYRWGRDVKTAEERMEEIRGSKHDVTVLDAESKLLAQVEVLMGDRDECNLALELARELNGEMLKVNSQISVSTSELSSLPNAKAVKATIDRAGEVLPRKTMAESVLKEISDQTAFIEKADAELSSLPNSKAVQVTIDQADKALSKKTKAESVFKEISGQTTSIGKAEEEVSGMPIIADVEETLSGCEGLSDTCWSLKQMAVDLSSARKEIESLEGEISRARSEADEKTAEVNEMLGSFTVCPLSLKPVKPGCLEP